MKNWLKCIPLAALALFVLAGGIFSQVSYAQTLTETASVSDSAVTVTERDASGEYDASQAITLSPGDDLTITAAGVYILSGVYEDQMIVIDAGKEDKVQLVLENAVINNENGPAIFVRSADKVFLTAAEGTVNSISDGTDYTLTEDDTKLDAAVFSKEDLTINGSGTLTITGNYRHAVVSKDDLVITAKALNVNAMNVGLSGKDSVTVSEAGVSIAAGGDGIRSENGSVFIVSGDLTIQSGDDGIHAMEKAEISGGKLTIASSEGIEATYVLITDGDITISASDDGINAALKSSGYRPTVEIRGGTLSITMGAGDTDGIDSNGDLIISGGTISVSGNSAFDYDGSVSFTGGSVTVNGQQVTTIQNQMMGGGFGGKHGFGGMGGFGGDPWSTGSFGGEPGNMGSFEGGHGGMGGFGNHGGWQ